MGKKNTKWSINRIISIPRMFSLVPTGRKEGIEAIHPRAELGDEFMRLGTEAADI